MKVLDVLRQLGPLGGHGETSTPLGAVALGAAPGQQPGAAPVRSFRMRPVAVDLSRRGGNEVGAAPALLEARAMVGAYRRKEVFPVKWTIAIPIERIDNPLACLVDQAAMAGAKPGRGALGGWKLSTQETPVPGLPWSWA